MIGCTKPMRVHATYSTRKSTSVPFADDSSSIEGCDRCFSGITAATQSALKYITVDDSTTLQSFGNQVADQLEACGGDIASAITGDIGQFRAIPLLSFQNQCEFDFEQYQQTAQVVQNWYTSQGIDIAGIFSNNGGADNTN
jgi:hypothetical protein